MQILVGTTEFIKSVNRANSLITARDNGLCVKHSKWNRFITITLLAVYIGVGIFYQIPSYIHLANTGVFVPGYGMYLPGLDTEQWTHCLILFLFNCLPFMIHIPVFTAFDNFIYFMFNNMFMISNVITNDIDEIGKMLTDKSTSEKEIKSKLTSIIQMHIDYNG